MTLSAAGARGGALAIVLALAGLAACAPGGDIIPVNGKTTSSTSGGVVPLTLVPPTLTAWLDQSGRWSTVRTVKLQAFGGAPNAAYSWAISRATAPPTPASTSSKTKVWPRVALASTTSSASRTRESSPPEATFASGAGSDPGLAEKSRVT